MNLREHYNNLYQDSIQKIKTNNYQVDKLIDSTTDNRRGITLLIRPSKHVKEKIQNFLAKVKAIEPQQYYYSNSDMHITVMSIISCYDGFDTFQIDVNDYADIIKKSIQGLPKFEIEFKGLTASPSCIMVKGFFKENTLNQIRENLRINFRNTNLEQSIDKRYSIKTAHSTIIRLRKQLANKEAFLQLIEENKDLYFGTFTVDTLELVFNDWYQRRENVRKLHEFRLSN